MAIWLWAVPSPQPSAYRNPALYRAPSVVRSASCSSNARQLDPCWRLRGWRTAVLTWRGVGGRDQKILALLFGGTLGIRPGGRSRKLLLVLGSGLLETVVTWPIPQTRGGYRETKSPYLYELIWKISKWLVINWIWNSWIGECSVHQTCITQLWNGRIINPQWLRMNLLVKTVPFHGRKPMVLYHKGNFHLLLIITRKESPGNVLIEFFLVYT